MGLLNWLLPKPLAITPSVPIMFFVRLDKDDWDSSLGAWRCPALKLPAVRVGEIRHAGQKQDAERYRVDANTNQIFWRGGRDQQPDTIALRLEVESNLLTAEKAAADTRDNASRAAVRVAAIGAIATVVVAVITGIFSYYVADAGNPSHNAKIEKTSSSPALKTDEAGCITTEHFKGTLLPGAAANHFGVKMARNGSVSVSPEALTSSAKGDLSVHVKICDVQGHCNETGLVPHQQWVTRIDVPGQLKFEVYAFPSNPGELSYDFAVHYSCS